MRILAVTNMYPSAEFPFTGINVERQVKGLREIGVDVQVLHIDRQRLGPAVYRTVEKRLIEEVQSRRPAVVHVMYGGVLADRATRAMRSLPRAERVPLLISYCGSDLLGEPTAGLQRRVLAWLGTRASHSAAKRADGILVKSSRLAGALPLAKLQARHWVVPSGVNLTRFRPSSPEAAREALGWAPDRLHVLFNLGDPVKRPELARAAVSRLASSGRAVDMHSLQGVAPADVPRWLNASHLVLLTSRHEGSPNIVKEALACDVPVVSVDVGDVKERISGVDGCYVAEDTPEALAAAMAQVADGLPRVNGRAAIEDLSLERVAQRIHHIYGELAGRETS